MGAYSRGGQYEYLDIDRVSTRMSGDQISGMSVHVAGRDIAIAVGVTCQSPMERECQRRANCGCPACTGIDTGDCYYR